MNDPKTYENFKKKADEIALNSKRILITAHKSPDDDSIASVLIVYYYLTEILKVKAKVEKIYTGERHYRWESFKNYDKIQFVEDMADHVQDVDTLFLLDVNEYSRVSFKPEELVNKKIATIMIDHHKNIPGEGVTIALTFPEVLHPSNADLLYSLFYKLSPKDNVPQYVYETILLGIYGDTGGLRYSVDKNGDWILSIVKEIVDLGDINIDILLSKFDKVEINALVLAAKMTAKLEKKTIPNWPDFSYLSFDKDFCNGYTELESDEAKSIFGGYLRKVLGCEWGFTLSPSDEADAWRLSFRSVPGCVNVRLIAKDFDGGGHDPAAGGKISYSSAPTLKDAEKIIFDYLKNNKPTFIPV